MKFKLQHLALALLLVCGHYAGAQSSNAVQQASFNNMPLPNRGCGTATLPLAFENWLQSVVPNTAKLGPSQVQSVFNIPVIVHVIHNNEALNSATATSGGNLNAVQIIDQINILNKDYNGLNPDTSLIPSAFKPLLGKFQFNFCLAVVNPTGGVLAEPGIDRINRVAKGWTAPPYSTSYIDATIKPNSIWDPTKYMNMWVCGISGGILGYATFPNPGTSGLSGLSPPYGSATTDGLVMVNTAFGSVGTAAASAPYNKGRTATHEIGHWLGLRHIWGDNGQCGATDYCNDTPPQKGGTASPAGCNYGCPTYPLNANTCTISSQSNTNGDMFMNYMDYTNDACMYMFTNDQKVRAQLIMTNSPLRASLLTSTVCNTPTITNEVGILYVTSPTFSQVMTCSTSISPSLILYNFGSNTVTSATFSYNVDGVGTQTLGWTGIALPNNSVSVGMPVMSNLVNGNHSYNVGVYLPNGSADPYMANNASNQYFSITGQVTLSTSANQTICPSNCTTLSAIGSGTSYTWNPGGISGSNAAVCPTISTIYTVSASNGTCTNTKTVSITSGGSLSVAVNSSSICSGNSATLTAGGASSYTWSTGSNASSIVVNPGVTATYTVLGSNGSCTGSALSIVTVNSIPSLTVTSTAASSICAGSSATLSASGATSYSWSSGATSSVTIVNPSLSTIYTVTGNNSGCSSSKTVAVIVGPSLALSITQASSAICSGNSNTLSASGASSYTWSTGSSLSSIVVSPSVSTVYSLQGSTGSCVGSGTVSVTVNATPTLVVNNVTICPGSTVALTASGAITYTWNGTYPFSTYNVSPSVTTVYTVSGTNLGCVSTKTVSVSIGSSLSVLLNSSAASVCSGGPATITASGAGSYTWSTGSNATSIVVNPSVSTSYSVLGQSGSCTGTAVTNVAVVQSPTLTLASSASGSICAGTSVTLSATGASTYSWSNGGSGNSIVVSPSVNTVYTTTGSIGGCSVSSSITVAVGAGSLNLTVNANPVSICSGGSTTLSANGATSYSWSTGSNLASIVVSPANTSTYSVFGSSGSCSGFGVLTVSVGVASPIVISVSPSASVCAGKTATLTASGGYATYVWSSPSFTGASVAVTPSVSTVYSVYASGGSSGCTNTKTVSISIASSPVSVVSSTNSGCGSSCSGLANANTSGGKAPYSYSLSAGSCSALPCTNLCPGLYTLYTTDSIGCSSFNIFSISSSANTLNTAITSINATCGSCANGMLTASVSGGTAPYSYSWAPSGGNSATAFSLTPRCYTVTIVDSKGCSMVSSGCVGISTGLSSVVVNAGDLLVYPNPAHDKVSVFYPAADFNGVLYNNLGQVVAYGSSSANLMELNTSQLTKGVYFLEVRIGDNSLRKKVVVE